jgi:hypothetical protein
MRRLLLTGAIVFIAPGTAAQAAVACVFSVFSIIIALYCQPHADTLDGRIYTVGTAIIFLSMFLSLAMKANVSNETDYSQDVFGVVLVVLNAVMMLAAVVQMALVGRRAYMSRQTSAMGLGKIDHFNDNDANDSVVMNTVPTVAVTTAATAATAATASADKCETVERGTSADNNEQQARQSEVRF